MSNADVIVSREKPALHQGKFRRASELIAIAFVVMIMAGFVGGRHIQLTSSFMQAETVIWYCAGEAVNAHADAYLVEPLRSCEIRLDPTHTRKYPWVEPAPLPGYALGAFALLAHLPFSVARALWFYGLLGAVILTAVMLGRMARIAPLPVLLCLAMVDGYLNLFQGEIPPLAVAALVASAAFGASKRYTAAAFCGALTMIEPHIGLSACLSMFVWWPRTRLPFILCATVLAGISVAAIGVSGNVEYFHTLLPLHAASEIAANDQFSLTRMLHILGFSDRVALEAGSVSYLVLTVVGVAIARRLAVSVDSPGLIVLQPSAMALLGGPFVHDLQMAAAIPAAILLAASVRLPVALRTAALVGIVLPWNYWTAANARGQLGILEVAAVAAALLVGMRDKPIKVRAALTLIGVCVTFGLASILGCVPQHRLGPVTVVAPAANAPGDISSANWKAHVSRDVPYSTADARDVAQKLPVWFALIAIVGMGVAQSRTRVRARRDGAVWDIRSTATAETG